MDDQDEYRQFLTYLWQTQVDTSTLQSRRGSHPFEDEYEYHLRQLADAMRLIRAIRIGVDSHDLTDGFVADRIGNAAAALDFNNRELERSDVSAVLDSYFDRIGAGLSADNLPSDEVDLLRARGFDEVADHLNGFVFAARAEAERRATWGRGDSRPSAELNWTADALRETARAYHDRARLQPDQTSTSERKERRWFKGFGQIVQGAAMSLADIGLAAGCFHFPVSPETQTWGALTSITAGVGTILNGSGDLRGE